MKSPSKLRAPQETPQDPGPVSKPRSIREALAVAAVVVLWAVIVACLVVLDRKNYGWMALLVYVALYFAIAKVESRKRKRD